jgi:hypothetical protein
MAGYARTVSSLRYVRSIALPSRARAMPRSCVLRPVAHPGPARPVGRVRPFVFTLAALLCSSRKRRRPCAADQTTCAGVTVGSPRLSSAWLRDLEADFRSSNSHDAAIEAHASLRDAYGDCRPSLGPGLAARVVHDETLIRRGAPDDSIYQVRLATATKKSGDDVLFLSPIRRCCRPRLATATSSVKLRANAATARAAL